MQANGGQFIPGASRSPSWGAWIEMVPCVSSRGNVPVAPPRGERGLKSFYFSASVAGSASLPLVGSVD